MLLAHRKSNDKLRLGQILLDAGIVSPEVLDHAILIARQSSMPIGRVLVMSGYVTDLSVEAALEAQAGIRDGTVEQRIAFELLKFAHRNQVSIEEAFRLHGLSRNLGNVGRVGKLILAAGLVDDAGIKCAARHAESTAFPLGSSMLALRLIDETTLVTCMNLATLLRDRRLSFLKAVRVLKDVVVKGAEFETALRSVGVMSQLRSLRPRIGELLVDAGLVCQGDRMILVEIGADQERPIGQLLVEYQMIPQVVLEAALNIQKMFDNPEFPLAKAVHLLKLVDSMQSPLEQVLAELDVMDQIARLLHASGVIDDSMIHDARRIADEEKGARSIPEILLADERISAAVVLRARECLYELQKGSISYERAMTSIVECIAGIIQEPQFYESEESEESESNDFFENNRETVENIEKSSVSIEKNSYKHLDSPSREPSEKTRAGAARPDAKSAPQSYFTPPPCSSTTQMKTIDDCLPPPAYSKTDSRLAEDTVEKKIENSTVKKIASGMNACGILRPAVYATASGGPPPSDARCKLPLVDSSLVLPPPPPELTDKSHSQGNAA